MRIARGRTKQGARYYLLSPDKKFVDCQIFGGSQFPARVRMAARHIASEGASDAVFTFSSVLSRYLCSCPDVWNRVERLSASLDPTMKLECPVTPTTCVCVGLNYREHARESNQAIPSKPMLFAKSLNAVSGHNKPIPLPTEIKQLDYEAELVVVLGRACRNVAVEDALSFVGGYACRNDVSARDLQFESGQWYRGKSADGFAPIGPWLVTKDEIPNPEKLGIQLRLNGCTMQDSNTEKLIFGIKEIVSFVSRTITLMPGDVIMTGTPPGGGLARKPPISMKHEDCVEVEIERVGILRNRVASSDGGSSRSVKPCA